jgi:hypothetical protein
MAFRFFLCFFLFRLFKVSKKRSLFFVSKKTFLGLFVCIFLRFLCAERERSSLREANQRKKKKKVFSFGSVIAFPSSNRRKASKKEKPNFLKIHKTAKNFKFNKYQIQKKF